MSGQWDAYVGEEHGQSYYEEVAERVVTEFITDCLGQVPTSDLVMMYGTDLGEKDAAMVAQYIDKGRVDLYVHW